MKNSRGQISSLVPWAIQIIVLIAVLSFGALFMTGMLSVGTGVATSATLNTTITNGTTSLTTFAGFTPLIVLVVILALFMALLMVVQNR